MNTRTICVPDDRHGIRREPAMWEQEVIDLYAEGFSHPSIAYETGVSKMNQVRILTRYGIPLRAHPNGSDRPRLMTDAEMLRGRELTDDHVVISEHRTRQTEREVAATMARTERRAKAA